jgi:hypothetical protein
VDFQKNTFASLALVLFLTVGVKAFAQSEPISESELSTVQDSVDNNYSSYLKDDSQPESDPDVSGEVNDAGGGDHFSSMSATPDSEAPSKSLDSPATSFEEQPGFDKAPRASASEGKAKGKKVSSKKGKKAKVASKAKSKKGKRSLASVKKVAKRPAKHKKVAQE